MVPVGVPVLPDWVLVTEAGEDDPLLGSPGAGGLRRGEGRRRGGGDHDSRGLAFRRSEGCGVRGVERDHRGGHRQGVAGVDADRARGVGGPDRVECEVGTELLAAAGNRNRAGRGGARGDVDHELLSGHPVGLGRRDGRNGGRRGQRSGRRQQQQLPPTRPASTTPRHSAAAPTVASGRTWNTHPSLSNPSNARTKRRSLLATVRPGEIRRAKRKAAGRPAAFFFLSRSADHGPV